MYKLHVIEPDDTVVSFDYKTKPTFQDMYSHISCEMIEMSKAYYPKYSNRKDGYVDIYFDEEFLMKENSNPNIGATVAWKAWQDKTGHMALPGSVLHGIVCVIQKEEKDETA
jgi:hypothetical protein